jgi:hypothetical protein
LVAVLVVVLLGVDSEDHSILDNSWVQPWLVVVVDNVGHWILDNNLVVVAVWDEE